MVGGATLGLAVHEVGPAGQVDRGLHQALVHRDHGVAEAAGAGLVAGGLRERLAERDRGVLDGVVRVDVQVALDLDGEVEQAVLAERGEHVVVEADAGRHVGVAVPVEVDRDQDLGLACVGRSTRRPVPCLIIGCRRALRQGVAECGHLLRRADRHAQPAVRTSLPDEHAAVEQALPDGVPSRRTRRTGRSWRRSRRRRSPSQRSQSTVRSRSARSSSTVASSSAACASATRATACETADR